MNVSRRGFFRLLHPQPEQPEPPARPQRGARAVLMPVIAPRRCLATTSFCTVCAEHCRVPGAIILEGGRPRILPTICTGCGDCVRACPAPILAMDLVPRGPDA